MKNGMEIYKVVKRHEGVLISSSWKLLAPEFRVIYKPGEWVSGVYPLFAFEDKRALAGWEEYDVETWLAEGKGVSYYPTKVLWIAGYLYGEQPHVLHEFWKYHNYGSLSVPAFTVTCEQIKLIERI